MPMPKNILIDLNVLLDVFLERDGYRASLDVIRLGELGNRQLFMSAHAVTTFAYLLEDAKVPKDTLLEHIRWVLQQFSIVPVDGAILDAAVRSGIKDYEDAVVEQAAVTCHAEAIVTRSTKDFKAGSIHAVTPEVFLGSLGSNS